MEASQDKTKRKYRQLLTQYEWGYQYSIFYQDHAQSKDLLEDMKSFKQRLIRGCPDQPFLARIQLLNRGSLQAFITIITTQRSMKLEQIAERHWPNTNLAKRRISDRKILKMAKIISSQKPHDLQGFFGVERVRRYSLLNESKLIPRVQPLESESEED